MTSVAEFHADTDSETFLRFAAADLAQCCRNSPCNLETMPDIVRLYRPSLPKVSGHPIEREWLITVQTVTAKQERTLVYAACYVSEYLQAFNDMLHRIGRAYPESGLADSKRASVTESMNKAQVKSKKRKAKARELDAAGYTRKEIAAELGLKLPNGERTVRRYLNEQ
jgi:hypothetical protein